jgi:hypothetical protein
MADPVLITTTSMAIHRPGQNFHYGEDVIHLRMVDEAGGAFFEIRQDDKGPIRADLEDLIAMLKAARAMLKQSSLDGDG